MKNVCFNIARTMLAVASATVLALPLGGLAALAARPAANPAGDSTPIGDKWAVVIGIGQFADAKVPTLKYSAKDAKDFYDFLVDGSGGHFAKDHVRLLVDGEATKVNIMDALGDSFLPHAASPEDLVVIYLSTHGSPAGADIRGVNYVVAHDTQVDKLFATGIEMRQLLRMIKERVHTKRILLVLDTCYSGAGAHEGGHKGLSRSNVNTQDVAQGIGSLVISSSSPDQRAWESDQIHNSYFTRYLIDALRQDNGQTSIDKAFNSMKQRVQSDVLKDKGELQTPVMSGAFIGPSLIVGVPSSVHRAAPTVVEIPQDTSAQPGSRSMGGSLATYSQHMRLAAQLIDQHKLWDAIHELEQAERQNPSSVEVHLTAADVLDAQARYNEAFESAKKAVMNDDQSARAREKLGRAYLRKGSSTDALRQAQMSVSLDPTDSSSHNLLGYIQEHEFKKVDEAEQEYRKALDLNGVNVRALVNLGLLLDTQGRSPDKVEDYFRKAVEADAEDWEARTALASFLYKRKGMYADAEKELREAIKLEPAIWRLHSELGMVLANDKSKYEEAESELRKGVELAPTNGMPHFMLGEFLAIHLERIDEAEREYRKALELNADLDEARVGLGNLLVRHRNTYDEADNQFRKALQINPRNAAAHVGLAMIYTGLYKNYTGAEQELRKALQLDSKYWLAYDRLGELLWLNLNRQDEAKKTFEKAIEVNPKAALPHYHLGKLLADHYQSYDLALKEFQKAIEIDPINSDFHTTLGWLQTNQYKNHKQAEASFRKAIELNLANSEAHYRLGVLLIERLGQRKAGEVELKKAHDQDSANKDLQKAFDRYVR